MPNRRTLPVRRASLLASAGEQQKGEKKWKKEKALGPISDF
jgi:hypothetical protein